MWVSFHFANGSNPYIATANNTLFWQITHYEIEQITETSFRVYGQTCRRLERQSREEKKNILRDFAIEWQYRFGDFNYSYYELSGWQSFFEEYGKKYGLIREFRENGII